jgi:hypothetical protein
MTKERELLREARDALEPGAPKGPQHMNTLDGRAMWLAGTRELRARIDALLAEQPAVKVPNDPWPDTEADGVVFCGKCGAQK